MKWALSACALTAVVLVGSMIAAQEPEKEAKQPAAKGAAEKWEYGEITSWSRTMMGQGGGKGGVGGGGAGGGPGGGVGGAPGGGAPVATTRSSVTWRTGDDETAVKTWAELATKLNLPAPKKELSETAHRMRVLNHLGSLGWELMARHYDPTSSPIVRPGEGTTTWTFKRKIAK